MDNSTRRQLLDKARSAGYTGSILEVFTAYDQGRDLVQEYVQQQQMQPQMQVAQTPQEQEQGLRPAHEAGQINQSMAFPDVQPGQSFNTVGMKVPINIDKVDNQGNLVESYKAVPPGIQNLPTGPYKGTVIETPARMKTGGVKTDPPAKLPWINAKGEYQNPNGVGPTVAAAKELNQEKLANAARTSSSSSNKLPSGAITPTMGPIEYALMAPVAASSIAKAAPIISSAMNAPIAGISGASVSNALQALGATMSTKEILDPTSNLRTNPNAENIGLTVLGYAGLGLGKSAIQGANQAGKFLTTQTPLKNAYKLNPTALKENPEMFLYRARPVGQDVNFNMAAQLKAKEAAGEKLSWWQKNLTNPQTNPQMAAREKYFGQWFEKDPSRLDFYINPETRNFADEDKIELLRTRLPKSEAIKLNVSQFDDAKGLSASPETEYILPKSMVESAERFPETSWKTLIAEDKKFNTPHWLKGYSKKQTGGADADATAVKVNPLVRQIDLTNYQESNPTEPSGFNYQAYYDKANKYLSRPVFKGTTLTAKDIADAAQDFYGSTNYEYPLDLLLTQGQIETKLGKTLKSQHNYFNVGNTDSGATRDFPSAKDSVKNYMELMYNDYLAKGQKSPEDLLKPQGFVNYRGSRYASAPNYETELDKQRQYISGYINKLEMGGSYQTNQEISMYDWRTGRPEESRKRYIIGGLKNRVLYNKAKYKR